MTVCPRQASRHYAIQAVEVPLRLAVWRFRIGHDARVGHFRVDANYVGKMLGDATQILALLDERQALELVQRE